MLVGNKLTKTAPVLPTQACRWLPPRPPPLAPHLPSWSPRQIVGCTAAEGSAAVWLSSPSLSPLSPSSGSGMYSMQSTGAASGKDLTVRGEGRFREKISTWPPAPSCPPPTWGRDPQKLSGGARGAEAELHSYPPASKLSQIPACHQSLTGAAPPAHMQPAVTEGRLSQSPRQQVRFRAHREPGEELR